MQIVRFHGADGVSALGAFRNDRVVARFKAPASTFPELLRLPLAEFRTVIERTVTAGQFVQADSLPEALEVWKHGGNR